MQAISYFHKQSPFRSRLDRLGVITSSSLLPSSLHFSCPCCLSIYTLSQPKKDRDVTERLRIYAARHREWRIKGAFMRHSRCSFLNAWENVQVARAITSIFLWNTRWRHGRSRGETKYSVPSYWNVSCPLPFCVSDLLHAVFDLISMIVSYRKP